MGTTALIPPGLTPRVFTRALGNAATALGTVLAAVVTVDDTVSVTSLPESAVVAESDPEAVIPLEVSEEEVISTSPDSVRSAFNLFVRLNPGRNIGLRADAGSGDDTDETIDYRTHHESWFAEDRDGDGQPEVDINSGEFETGLAALLGVGESEINDAPLDAIFGNQDGRLNGDDLLTAEEFIARLEIAVRYFEVSSRTSGGQRFSTFLRNDTVVFVNTSVLSGGLDGFEFNSLLERLLQNPENYDYTAALNRLKDMWGAAGSAWVELEEGLAAEDRQTINEDVMYNLGILCDEEASDSGKAAAAAALLATLNEQGDIGELLFFAYISTLETDLVQHRNDIEGSIDWEDPTLRSDFMTGLFTDYVLLSTGELERNDSIDAEYIQGRAEVNSRIWNSINGTGPSSPDDALVPVVNESI